MTSDHYSRKEGTQQVSPTRNNLGFKIGKLATIPLISELLQKFEHESNRLLNTVLPVLKLLHSDIYSSNDRRQRPAA